MFKFFGGNKLDERSHSLHMALSKLPKSSSPCKQLKVSKIFAIPAPKDSLGCQAFHALGVELQLRMRSVETTPVACNYGGCCELAMIGRVPKQIQI